MAWPWLVYLQGYSFVVQRSAFVFWVNKFFVEEFGFIWFSLAWWTLLLHNSSRLNKHAQKYAVATICWLVYTVWFFGLSIFERLNVFMGGHCEVSGQRAQVPMYLCYRTLDARWVDAFDASGHLFFLSLCSLILLREVLNRDGPKPVRWGVLALIGIWYLMYNVTCVFFHTMAEKVVGLACGLLVVGAVHYIDREEAESVSEEV